MSDIERKLRSTLYRAFCPDSAELGDYHFGLLAAGRRLEIHAHLRDCPHCTRELAELGAYLDSVRGDLEPGLGAQLRRLVASLVTPGAPSGAWSPALAGVRGEAGETLSFSAEGYHIVLDIQTDPEQPDRKSILGLLVGSETAGFTARLYRQGVLVAQTQADEYGSFAVNPLPPGEYSLSLSSASLEIRVEPIHIRPI